MHLANAYQACSLAGRVQLVTYTQQHILSCI